MVVVVRCTTPPAVPSSVVQCSYCGHDCWLSRYSGASTLALAAAQGDPSIMCDTCFFALMKISLSASLYPRRHIRRATSMGILSVGIRQSPRAFPEWLPNGDGHYWLAGANSRLGGIPGMVTRLFRGYEYGCAGRSAPVPDLSGGQCNSPCGGPVSESLPAPQAWVGAYSAERGAE